MALITSRTHSQWKESEIWVQLLTFQPIASPSLRCFHFKLSMIIMRSLRRQLTQEMSMRWERDEANEISICFFSHCCHTENGDSVEFPISLHLRSRQSANQSNSFNYRRAHVTFELITSHELAVWLKCDPIFSAKMTTVCSTAVHLFGMNTKSDCDTTQRTVIVNDSMLNLFNQRVNFFTDSETESRNEGDEQHGKSK